MPALLHQQSRQDKTSVLVAISLRLVQLSHRQNRRPSNDIDVIRGRNPFVLTRQYTMSRKKIWNRNTQRKTMSFLSVEVVEGNLLDQPVDAIVNAGNRNLFPWWLLPATVHGPGTDAPSARTPLPLKLHSLTRLSSPPEANVVPSGEKARQRTKSECPDRTAIFL